MFNCFVRFKVSDTNLKLIAISHFCQEYFVGLLLLNEYVPLWKLVLSLNPPRAALFKV